jgi:hypothetical protein
MICDPRYSRGMGGVGGRVQKRRDHSRCVGCGERRRAILPNGGVKHPQWGCS